MLFVLNKLDLSIKLLMNSSYFNILLTAFV